MQHILLVDKPGEDRDALVETITRAGYLITVVESQHDAMTHLRKQATDLVVTELMVPDINGWDLLAEVKARYPNVHVVVMTGRVSDAAEDILTDMKADGYLVKPVIPERVRVLLRALLDPRNLDWDAEAILISAEEVEREALTLALEDRGIQVVAFNDSKSLLRHIRTDVPDLVVVDLNERLGVHLGLCHVLRRIRNTVYMPILLIVQTPSRTLIEKAIRMRINGILTRPFTSDVLGERAIQLVKQADFQKKKK